MIKIGLVAEILPALVLPKKTYSAFVLACLALLSNKDQQKILVGLVETKLLVKIMRSGV